MIDELSLATNIVSGNPEVRCFTDEMQDFYKVVGVYNIYPNTI